MTNFKDGYQVFNATNENTLNEIINKVKELFIKNFDIDERDRDIFNDFHKILPKISSAELNEKRTKIIKELNESLDCGKLLFEAFKDIIIKLIGPDILVQKNCNLVIQPPLDPNPSELHRDAPANSPYEIVLWVPLVNCYKTKAMYIVNYKKTSEVYNEFLQTDDWESFEKEAIRLSKHINVKVNQGLIFSAAVLHGSNINQENETRISLNIRFKSLFSPSGLKNQMQYFKLLQVSDLVKIGADLEAKTLLK